MIVCHCVAISDADIRRAVDWMRASDPDTVITPGKVYRALGKRAECGGCLPLFIETMSEQSTLAIPMHLRALRRAPTQENPYERRPESNRLSQQGAQE